MNKKSLIFGLLIAVLMMVCVGCGKKKETANNIPTFADRTSVEEFKNIPLMETKGNYFPVEDYGSDNYMALITETTVEEYMAYLKTMKSAGFKKHSDNLEDGMEGYAYTASFTKGKLTVTVSYSVLRGFTYISASYDLPLSEHLIYKDEYVQNKKKDKIKVHMLQMVESQGCSFIIELKNGHFVVFDGGLKKETENFMKTIQKLTPEGEKPVIEAWFLSHCHNDHYGVIQGISQDQTWLDQIYVNGFYYVEPSAALFRRLTTQPDPVGNERILGIFPMFSTEDGVAPNVYRPALGQRYYFGDIMIDVALTLEQIAYNQYRGTDFNDTSTWLMCHIEGQRMLFGGDAGGDATNTAIAMFDKDYLDMDIFLPFHHGINVYDRLTEISTYDVLLYSSFRAGSLWDSRADLAAVPQNDRLKAKAKEVFHHGNGTVTLTFPYKIGTAEIGEDWQDDYTLM